MSMEEWPDDHLDKLFRKSAEEFDPPFNPEDWADMSRRLDEHDRHALFDRISRWGGIGALLLLLLAGLEGVTHNNDSASKRQQTGRPTQRAVDQPGTASLIKTAANQLTAKIARPAEARPIMTTSVNVPDQQRTRPESSVENIMPSTSAPARQETTNMNDSQASGRVARSAPKREKQSAALPDQSALSVLEPAVSLPALVADSSPVTVGPSVADGQWLPALAPVMGLTALVEQTQPLPEPAFQEPVAVAVRQAVPRLSGLSVMLFASPDLSGIGLLNFERPGSNAGLAIQYQITDRLSVNAGVMYSNKRYQNAATDYVWPGNTYLEVWPTEISGKCQMIDVPLNVRYDWLLRPRSGGRAPARWFATTGLTSYFIQREVYNYLYDNPSDPRIKKWSWDNQRAGQPGGTFGFSNLNISIGYEQPITRRLSWQVEPFMKVPLQGVGHFKVRLLSTGAFVGLRYRL